ncbi:MAG: DUF4880 domain-containing protein, partial [Hydrogenophaga sp.]|nr:DUF4880 domain-containing protein [Hydrogenophaga sp.]NIN26584.1 DUF4880 domain-containing protein [Hydrogenophaga sp.]NIN31459.1 DUF4880 domain-containing protein [Hydrogenophaga sp.]NIN55514.1 DUF4880 domain-containing protein [Hydrogenophaga sp.]NIO51849.1 DUF4880 domain-containing protein [Hydrogenophaga sp.]
MARPSPRWRPSWACRPAWSASTWHRCWCAARSGPCCREDRPVTAEDERIAQAAAQWLVRLSADDPQERRDAGAGFEAWKRADPRHAAVARGMEDFIGHARGLRGDGAPNPARAALDAVL